MGAAIFTDPKEAIWSYGIRTLSNEILGLRVLHLRDKAIVKEEFGEVKTCQNIMANKITAFP